MNRFCSIFSQLLKLFPRLEFEKAVKETRAHHHARGFTCWEQLVAMLFCQLGRAQSLREITGGLASCEGKCSDITVARRLTFQPGTIVVMDRGYLGFAWFAQLTATGVFFVSRPKHNTVYEVIEVRPVPENSLVVADEVIRMSGPQGRRDCPHDLRRIEVVVPETGEVLTLGFAATTIGAIYKDHWQVELFFKAIKQNLKVKTFVGTSANALRIQIWTALIAMLIIRYLQLRSRYN